MQPFSSRSHWQLNIYFPIFLSLGFYQQPSRTRKYLEVPKGKRKNCRTISLVDWEVHNYSVSKLSIMYCCFKCRLLVTISKRWINIYECYIFIISRSQIITFPLLYKSDIIDIYLYLQKTAHRITNIASCISYLQGAIIRSRVLLYASSTQGMELDT